MASVTAATTSYAATRYADLAQPEGVTGTQQGQRDQDGGVDEVVPMNGLLAGGSTAVHIRTVSNAPPAAASRIPPSRPSPPTRHSCLPAPSPRLLRKITWDGS
jgi:hypothetical protein